MSDHTLDTLLMQCLVLLVATIFTVVVGFNFSWYAAPIAGVLALAFFTWIVNDPAHPEDWS